MTLTATFEANHNFALALALPFALAFSFENLFPISIASGSCVGSLLKACFRFNVIGDHVLDVVVPGQLSSVQSKMLLKLAPRLVHQDCDLNVIAQS